MATNEAYQGTKVIIRPPNAGASLAESGPTQAEVCAWIVFLSSTIGDLENYRQEVQDALLKQAQVACFLSEDWINTYGPTIKKCREELEKAQGFIGIFAYWYGSIPPGEKRSITHLEFTWALEKWQHEKSKPIAILMPKSASKAERKLKKIGAALVTGSKAKKKRHADLLKAFHKEVADAWELITPFKDEHDLREKVIVICLQWRLGRPLDAATGAVDVVERKPPARRVTGEEKGLLGRDEHLDVVDKILNQVTLYSDVPAVGMLVYGDEDAAQRFFLRQLKTRKKLRSGRPVEIGMPQLEQYDVKALTQWAGESVGVLEKGKECASPEELAELIHEELQNQQLGFILDQVYRLTGGVTTFYDKFWQPLYARLVMLRKQKPLKNQHRLIAIVVDYDDQSLFDNSKVCQFSKTVSAQDYSRMWLLPELNDISAGDLADWFDVLDVPHDRRAALVTLALKNSKGQNDGTPLRVFDRLSQSSLWTNGEES
jgi:hypothetical protein